LDAVLFAPTDAPRVAYVGPFRNQTKLIAWDALKKFARDIPGDFNETELKLTLAHNNGQLFLAGADGVDHLRGVHLNLLVMDEPAFHPPEIWPLILRPTLAARRGRCLMIGRFLEKANHFYQTWEKAGNLAEWGRLRIPASESGILSDAELASARASMTEEQYAREYELEPLLVTEASIYGKWVAAAWREYRIGHVPHDPRYDVFTAWDWGRRDQTVCWFGQRVGRAFHLIDYVADSGLTVPDYMDMLREKKRERGYSYSQHYGPHDTDARTIHAESSIADEAAERGVFFEVIPRGSVAAGINKVREMLPLCWFDAERCADGITALEEYRYTWNPSLGVFSKEPEHSKHSHGADAFRIFAMAEHEAPEDDDFTPSPTVMEFDIFSHRRGR
jgi:phage terminase large subunit